jgi:hypothetical protein
MLTYIIIELEDGLTAVELPIGRLPEDVAADHGGVLIDEGPFASLEEAEDAIDYLDEVEEEGPRA